jgi:hypothetical protein
VEVWNFWLSSDFSLEISLSGFMFITQRLVSIIQFSFSPLLFYLGRLFKPMLKAKNLSIVGYF